MAWQEGETDGYARELAGAGAELSLQLYNRWINFHHPERELLTRADYPPAKVMELEEELKVTYGDSSRHYCHFLWIPCYSNKSDIVFGDDACYPQELRSLPDNNSVFCIFVAIDSDSCVRLTTDGYLSLVRGQQMLPQRWQLKVYDSKRKRDATPTEDHWQLVIPEKPAHQKRASHGAPSLCTLF